MKFKITDEDQVHDQDDIFVPVYRSMMINDRYTGNEILAWIGLKSYGVNSGYVFPKKNSLEESCKLKKTVLKETLKKLEEKGVIVIVPNFDENWKQKANDYFLAKYDSIKGDWDSSSLDYARQRKEKVLSLLELHKKMKKEKELGQGGTSPNSQQK